MNEVLKHGRALPQAHLSRKLVVTLAAALFLTGCLHRRPHRVSVPGGAAITKGGMEGLASWYGYPYQGRPTANGEIYNMYAMTAAHRTLPFGTWVRAHDLDNGKSVDVRINDRGPFIPGRIIDLSYRAAEDLNMVGPGSAHVELEILNPEAVYGPNAPPGIYAVQVGAFANPNNAQRLKTLIEPHFGPIVIQTFDGAQGLLYRVRVGRLFNEPAAHELASDLKQAGLVVETYVVRLN
ncbi:MAG: septal ring lytic transglycosylase RlpA family protein [Terriglobia bacterium]